MLGTAFILMTSDTFVAELLLLSDEADSILFTVIIGQHHVRRMLWSISTLSIVSSSTQLPSECTLSHLSLDRVLLQGSQRGCCNQKRKDAR